MRVIDAVVEEFGSELEGSIADAKRSWGARAGLVLVLRDEAGHLGLGEASPLPGFSSESIEGVRGALRGLPLPFDLSLENGLRAALEALPFARHAPAARFALETALIDLLGAVSGTAAHTLWRAASEEAHRPHGETAATTRTLDCAALLGPADGKLGERADRALAAGARCLKVKVGRDPAGDAAALRDLRSRVGPRVALRADANLAFSAADAQRFLDALEGADCELIEDPTPLAAIEELSSPVPLALDEPLLDPGHRPLVEELLQAGAVRALVLKPMALGGWNVTTELAELAHRHGGQVIVSHLLDGPIARAAAAELALALADSSASDLLARHAPLAQGLGAHAGLSCWPTWRFAAIDELTLRRHGEPGLGRSGNLSEEATRWLEATDRSAQPR